MYITKVTGVTLVCTIFYSKINSLKDYNKCILFHLKYFFGSWSIKNLRGNLEDVEIIMTSWNSLHELPFVIFGKMEKAL